MSTKVVLLSAVAICGIVRIPEATSQGFVRPVAQRYPWNTYTTEGSTQPEITTTERAFIQPGTVLPKIPPMRPPSRPARQEFVVVWDRITRERFWIPREQFYTKFQGLLDQTDLPFSSGCGSGSACRRPGVSVPHGLVDARDENIGSVIADKRFSENSDELQTAASTRIGQVAVPPGNGLSAFLGVGDSRLQSLDTDSYLNNPVIFNPHWFSYHARRNDGQNGYYSPGSSGSSYNQQFHRQEYNPNTSKGRWSWEDQQRVSPCVTLDCKNGRLWRHVLIINHGKHHGSTTAKPTWKPMIYRTSTTPGTTTESTQPITTPLIDILTSSSTNRKEITESTSVFPTETSSPRTSEVPEASTSQTEPSSTDNYDYELPISSITA